MNQWIDQQITACGEAIDRHVTSGGRDTPAFATMLARTVAASAQTLPSQCNEAMQALGKRLMDEAGPARRVSPVGIPGGTVMREPRAQIMHDLGFLFEKIGEG